MIESNVNITSQNLTLNKLSLESLKYFIEFRSKLISMSKYYIDTLYFIIKGGEFMEEATTIYLKIAPLIPYKGLIIILLIFILFCVYWFIRKKNKDV